MGETGFHGCKGKKNIIPGKDFRKSRLAACNEASGRGKRRAELDGNKIESRLNSTI